MFLFLIKSNDKALLEGFISKVEESLNEHNVAKKLEKIEKELSTLESKKLKLVDMHLEGVISKEDFENKYQEIILKIEDKQAHPKGCVVPRSRQRWYCRLYADTRYPRTERIQQRADASFSQQGLG